MRAVSIRWFTLACIVIAAVPPVFAQDAVTKRVALVFDDGPEPDQGERLRARLADAGVVASFAHVGRNVRKHPASTRAAHAAGHEIVNHSDTHAPIAEKDADGVRQEVVGGREAIEAAIGQAPRWYWPPFLAVDSRLVNAVQEAGLTIYVPHHLVDSKDWNRATSAEEILRRATTGVQDGSVLLFHEWREETIAQLPAILAELRRQGCVFYTFSGLRAELDARPPAGPADATTQAMFTPRAPSDGN